MLEDETVNRKDLKRAATCDGCGGDLLRQTKILILGFGDPTDTAIGANYLWDHNLKHFHDSDCLRKWIVSGVAKTMGLSETEAEKALNDKAARTKGATSLPQNARPKASG